MIHAFPEGSEVKESNRTYDRLHLLENWLGLDDLLPLLGQIAKGNYQIHGKSVSFSEQSQIREGEYHASNNNYAKYPGHLFIARGSGGNPPIAHWPTASYKFPYHSSGFQAVADWSQIASFHAAMDARIGCTLLFLPELRAQFGSFTYEDGMLRIQLIVQDPEGLALKVKGSYTSGSAISSFDIRVSSASVTLKLGEDVEELDCCLIGKDDTLFDFHRETRFWTIGQERARRMGSSSDSAVEDARRSIEHGEGDTIEFKPHIKPGDAKQNQLIETAIAFANTKGGKIFIGVDDRCMPQGIEKELAKQGQKEPSSLEAQLERYKGALRQVLAGRLNHTQGIKLDVVRLTGHTLLVIHVPESRDSVCFDVQTKKIYVRKGANNVFPDPVTELPELLRRGRRSVPLGNWPLH